MNALKPETARSNHEMPLKLCGLLRCPVHFIAHARNAPGEACFSHVRKLGSMHTKMQNLDEVRLSAGMPRVQPGAGVVRAFPR